MSIPKQFRLSISEFAKLCNSSRKTLIYYDNIGLLKPFGRTEQGYRYYAANQVAQYHFIQLLQGADYSLEEIERHLFQSYLYEDIPSLLVKYNNLLEKRKKLDAQIAQFSTLISMTKEKNEQSYLEPTLLYRDAPEHYFITKFPSSVLVESDEFLEHLQKHTELLSTRTDILQFPPCMIIDVSYLPENTHYVAAICHRYTANTTDFEQAHTFTLPIGHYITCSCPCSVDDISNMLLSIYHYAIQNSYSITGNFLCIQTIFNYGYENNQENYRALLPVSLEHA